MKKVKLALSAKVIEPYFSNIEEVCDVTLLGKQSGKPYGEIMESQELLEAALGHEIVYINAESVTREMIKAWKESGMKLMGCGRGTPVNVDWEAIREFDVPLVYTPGRNAESVAEFAFGLILAVIRRIAPNYKALRDGRYLGEEKDIYDLPWARRDVIWIMPDGTSPIRSFLGGFDLYGRTLGIVGLGNIGSRVARIAHGFGMEVKANDPYITDERFAQFGAKKCDVDEVLGTADIVTIHIPVNPQTREMIDASWFNRMRKDAYFINTARAAVVDQKAMIEALESGRIAGAAADVMWEEPIPKNHPMLHMDNVVNTSHIAAVSTDVVKWQSEMIADEILRYCNGQPPQRLWTRTKLYE